MKKISFLASLLLVVSISFTACREQSEKEKLVEEMKEEGAEIDTKTDDDGNYKIKMESEEKEVKIKEDAENQFKQQSDQQLLNDVTEALIEKTNFDLPAEFLQRWIMVSGEKELTEEEAKEGKRKKKEPGRAGRA